MNLRDRLTESYKSTYEQDRGAILVLSAMMLVVLMAMAALAVDYGWLAYNRLEVRKAAESAALAGVVHMPLPGSVTFGAGAEPYDVAVNVAGRNGYVDGVGGVTVTPQETSSAAQLKVSISDHVETFFLKMFISSPLTVSGDATAEQLPPLKLGSDARDVNFYLAVNGDRTNKAQGDAYTSECYGDSDTPCEGSNFEFNQGLPNGNPSYYFAIDVPAGHIGDDLVVQLYDPQMNTGGNADDRELNAPVESNPYARSRLQFRLLEPDLTPNSWMDNTDVVCTQTYYQEDHRRYNASNMDTWVSFCEDTAIQGIYVLEVRQTGNVDLLNAFSLRAEVDDNLDNGVAVYGLGAMSLWNSQAGAGTQFKVVRLDDVYAGSRLVIQLWDIGDITGTGSLEFKGSLTPYECKIRERDEKGVVISVPEWGADDGNSGCYENIEPEREYNNEWLDFAFEIPPEFTCTGDACWATVQYNLPGTPHDRTTWSAFLDGLPIHLIP